MSTDSACQQLRRAINRRNALKSTGPRTAAGKARAAKNALQHGLAVPIDFLPELAQRRDGIMQNILARGEHSDEEAKQLAGILLDLERINKVRHAAFTNETVAVGNPEQEAALSSALKVLLATLRYEREARVRLRRFFKNNR